MAALLRTGRLTCRDPAPRMCSPHRKHCASSTSSWGISASRRLLILPPPTREKPVASAAQPVGDRALSGPWRAALSLLVLVGFVVVWEVLALSIGGGQPGHDDARIPSWQTIFGY